MVRAAVDSYVKLNILVGTAGINWEEKSTVELKEEVFVKTMAIKRKVYGLG